MRIDSTITIGTRELTRKQWVKLFEKLTFADADGNEWESWTHRLARDEVVLPRGALDMIPAVDEVVDARSLPKRPRLEHVKPLDSGNFSGQRAAVEAMFANVQGQLRLPTGSGKTTIGCAFMAECETTSLVLVHTRDLVEQWVDRLREEVPDCDVGLIMGRECRIGHVTVGTMQTVRDRYLRSGGKFWRKFGCLIVDESAHAANDSYSWLLNVCPAYYRFGLSASDKRSDGKQQLVRYGIGPVIYRMPFKSQVPIEVQPVKTSFRSSYSASQYTRLVSQLVRDDDRNALAAKIVEREVEAGHTVLLLSRQIGHLHAIADHLPSSLDDQYAIVTGQSRWRKSMIEALRSGELRCILGTQIFEEGVDVPSLDRVVLAFPSTDVTTLQKVGRVTRSHEGKSESLVLDMVDGNVPCLIRQYAKRKHWYRQSKIHVRTIESERSVMHGTDKKKGRILLSDLRARRSRRAA